MEIILDLGSGNTCRNSIEYGKRMIDEITKVDNKKHDLVLKMQLFRDQPPNEHLKKNVFAAMYDYSKIKGYKMTASVFDLESLKFLLTFKDLPFIKIACRPELYWLIGEIPRKMPVYMSLSLKDYWQKAYPDDITQLFCVPKYPAKTTDYKLPTADHASCISDHTIGLDLLKEARPTIWECHFVLEHDDNNPDGGPWAKTPTELKEALEL
jgi:sialic acid synthase SpsE